VIRDVFSEVFGPNGRFVGMPVEGKIYAFGSSMPAYDLVLGLAGVGVAIALYILFARTLTGKRLRASVEDRQMAQGVGLATGRIGLLALALGGALAGLAGALLSPIVSVDPFMGFDYIVRAFLTLILGGLGSIVGASVGAAGLGTTETVLTTMTSSVAAQLLVFGAVGAVLLVRSRLGGERTQ
jgi:branched-chain amino acid transport system permease protein/urea transport system permease protein